MSAETPTLSPCKWGEHKLAWRKLRWRKLPARAQVIVMPMILSLLMSGIVSSISTVKAIGFAEVTIPRLLQAWGVSYLIAFPAALLVMPIVRRAVAFLVESPEKSQKSVR